MEFLKIVLIPLTVLVISALLYRNYARTNPPQIPPGPWPLPIIGNLHTISNLPHRCLCNLAKGHGPIMTLYLGSFRTIVVSSSDMAKQILKTHDHIFANRPEWEGENHNESPSKISFAQYGPYWKFMRKICTLELLSPKRMESSKSIRVQEVFSMIQSILQESTTNNHNDGNNVFNSNNDNCFAVDISRQVSLLTNNIICRMTFGKNCSETYLGGRSFKEVLEDQFAVSGSFGYEDFIPLLGWLDLQGIKRRQIEIHRVFDGFLKTILEEHFERRKVSGSESKDFVDVLISLSEDATMDMKITPDGIKEAIFDILVAATDTSGNTLEWAMSELLRNPSVMKRAQEELESVVGLDCLVEESMLPHLQYLQSVVKETLRLYPPAPLLLPHESMEHSTVGGYQIPQKTRVIVNAWAIGKDPLVWEEANVFKPERFLESRIDVKGQDFGLIPFGSGRRGCPGISLALCMIQLGLAQLLHCFDWYLPEGITPQNLDMSEAFGITMPRAVHLHAIAIPRLPLRMYHPEP